MPRYRIRYFKEGAARFISHLDFIRTFERAVRRAGLPVSLTEGFNPHPRFSFGPPLPVGMAGLNEYLDIDLDNPMPVEEIVSSLDRTMPPGLGVTGVCPVDEKSPALMAEVDRSVYQVRAEGDSLTACSGELKKCLEQIMAAGELKILRRKKDGREVLFDIRPGLISLEVTDKAGQALLQMELTTGSSFNVRPEEVMAALREHCGIPGEGCFLDITRTGIAGRGGKCLFPPAGGSGTAA